jgi:hypothetical protein
VQGEVSINNSSEVSIVNVDPLQVKIVGRQSQDRMTFCVDLERYRKEAFTVPEGNTFVVTHLTIVADKNDDSNNIYAAVYPSGDPGGDPMAMFAPFAGPYAVPQTNLNKFIYSSMINWVLTENQPICFEVITQEPDRALMWWVDLFGYLIIE